MSNEAIHYYMPSGAIKTILPIGAISGSWSICISCICITLSLESCVCSYSIFYSDEYFKLKRNVLARFFDDGCIFLFDVIIYYWFYFMGVED